MVVTRSMSKKAKEKIDTKDVEEKVKVRKTTLDDEAFWIYIYEIHVIEYRKKYATTGFPMEAYCAARTKWESLSRKEKAPFLQKARDKRAASRERSRKRKFPVVAKEKIENPSKDDDTVLETKVTYGKFTLDKEALCFYIRTSVMEYMKKHPKNGYPTELSFAGHRKWPSLSRKEKAPFLQMARDKRAASREFYRKWKNRRDHRLA